MTDKKITQLTALTGANAVAGDQLAIVDVSDTTMSASGTTKKIALSELQAAPLSGGTANGVAFLDASKVLTTGSALTFDGTQLDIPAGTAALPSLSTTGDTNTGIFFPAADTIAFSEGGAEAMRIDSAGNVGIGTSSPEASLHSSVALPDVAVIQRRTSASGDIAYLHISASGAGQGISRSSFIGSQLTGGGARAQSLLFGTTPGFAVAVERMRITNAGNVGIGTSLPSASAILDAQSTTKGVRMPNMTTTQKNAIASPAAGLMVYDTTLAKLCVYTTAWETITSL